MVAWHKIRTQAWSGKGSMSVPPLTSVLLIIDSFWGRELVLFKAVAPGGQRDPVSAPHPEVYG